MREPLTTQVQRELRVRIKEQGLTLEQVGDRLDMSGAAVSNALRRPSVHTATLERIAAAAGVVLQVTGLARSSEL